MNEEQKRKHMAELKEGAAAARKRIAAELAKIDTHRAQMVAQRSRGMLERAQQSKGLK